MPFIRDRQADNVDLDPSLEQLSIFGLSAASFAKILDMTPQEHQLLRYGCHWSSVVGNSQMTDDN